MNTSNIHYSTFGKFIIRLPHYPLQYLFSLLDNPAELKEKMSDSTVREAIFLASPVLDREIQKYIDGKIKSNKEIRRIENSFLKYFTRLCSRCTPYGTFSTCSCGTIGNDTLLSVNEDIKRHIQFDTYFLSELVRYVSNMPEVRKLLRFYTNTTIYSVGEKYRYIEFKLQKNRHLHQISSVTKNKYLNTILAKAVNGIKYDDIINILVALEIEKQDAIEYVEELIQNQLLQAELELNLNENGFSNQLADFFENRDFVQSDANKAKDFFITAKGIFEYISEKDDVNNHLNSYKLLIERTKEFPFSVEENCVLHVDSELKQSDRISLGNDVIQDLNNIIMFFCNTYSLQPDRRLNKFANAFYEKYEEKEVPLLVALDPDMGIGYPPKHGHSDKTPWLSSLNIPHTQRINTYVSVDITLLKKLLEMKRAGGNEIVFENNDKNIQENVNILPDVLFCMFKLMKGKNSNLIVEPSIGISATKLIGRFSYMNNNIRNLFQDIAHKEQESTKDAVCAEIKHIPSSRIGNINNTTHVWEYEILLLTGSEIPNNNKIPISDLMLSYKNGKLVLRSHKLNKQILPVLSNAHNFNLDTQPVYKFLCDLQYQHKPESLYFSWGNLRQVLDDFPRVRYKNCILSLAFWVIKKSDISEICKNVNAISEIRKKRNIPRYVYLADGDNTLFVDFDSKESTDAFVSTIKDRQEIVVKETLLDVCDYENNPFINECIVPFYKQIK